MKGMIEVKCKIWADWGNWHVEDITGSIVIGVKD
jgi:hypothetical protein